MIKQKLHLSTSFKIDLLIFFAGFCTYFFYFHDVFFNLNSLLSSITNDSLKNYYTFVHHVKNDSSLLNFSGMNFPFGEHVVYTDCQPLLTWIFKALPFTHNYLIGILHSFIFLSFIISPVILNKILKRFGIALLPSVLISLGITLLSPQFPRIYSGHYSLAYACMIPLAILLILRCFEARNARSAAWLCAYSLVVFFIHPYVALGLCVFAFISIFIFELPSFKKEWRPVSGRLLLTLLPIVLFQVFMKLSDSHSNRPTQPFGLDTSVTKYGSMLTPVASPFRETLEALFKTSSGDFEGYCYIGIVLICLIPLFLLALPFLLKKLRVQRELMSLFLASALLLLVAFGVHKELLKLMNINSAALNQFRALGRFSWFFYYMLPLFIFYCLYHSLRQLLPSKIFAWGFGGLAFLFFVFNFIEMGAIFTMHEALYFWKDRNFFNERFLNAEEKTTIARIRALNAQAIVPLPTYYVGSEMYGHFIGDGFPGPMISSVIYSYHTGLPIISCNLSRTSLIETEDGINILNSYKKNNAALNKMSQQRLIVLKTTVKGLPDCERLWSKATVFERQDTLEFGYVSKHDLSVPALDKTIVDISPRNDQQPDAKGVVFVSTGNRQPYVYSTEGDYDLVFKLDSNRLSGAYIASLHYYYKRKTYEDVMVHLLVTNEKTGEWLHYMPMRMQSGFYPGFAVFEFDLDLDKKTGYKFLMKRNNDHSYKVSDFMLRPKGTTVRMLNGKDTVYNNFPMY